MLHQGAIDVVVQVFKPVQEDLLSLKTMLYQGVRCFGAQACETAEVELFCRSSQGFGCCRAERLQTLEIEAHALGTRQLLGCRVANVMQPHEAERQSAVTGECLGDPITEMGQAPKKETVTRIFGK